MGDTQQDKEFAQQFYLNRDVHTTSQSDEPTADQSYNDQYQSYSKQQHQQQTHKQKKRSKGQKVDSQLLGFTVQPDPNLKNRAEQLETL